MKKALRYHPVLALAAIVAACLAVAAGEFRASRLSRLRESRLGFETRALEINSKIALLGAFEDSRLQALLEECRKFDSQLGPRDTWGTLVEHFGARWSVESSSIQNREGYTLIEGSLRMSAPGVGDWREIVSALERAQELPGVSLESLEVSTAATGDTESFAVVKVGVAVREKNG